MHHQFQQAQHQVGRQDSRLDPEEDNPGNEQKLEMVEGRLVHQDKEVVHQNDWDPVVSQELGELEELGGLEGLGVLGEFEEMGELEQLEELLKLQFDSMVLNLKVRKDVVQQWMVER